MPDKPEVSGSGTSRVYSIEARLSPSFKQPPCEKGGLILDSEWRQVPLARPSEGVPTNLRVEYYAVAAGFVSHVSALALAWWFLAQCDAYGGVEVRIVEHVHEYSYSITRKAEGEPFTEPSPLKSLESANA